MPEGAVYVGRVCNFGPWRLRQSKWHNPYKVGRDGALKEVLAKYERHLYDTGLINAELLIRLFSHCRRQQREAAEDWHRAKRA